MSAPEQWAADLDNARRGGTTLGALLSDRGLSTLADAYAVQRALTARRVARGERIIGWKLGYTSLAMREQMGIDEPNYGPLTDAMLLTSGTRVPSSALQPRVEPEIAVVLDRAVPPNANLAEVLACCRAAHAALEVVDSIWADYRFTLLDNTADGSSAGWFVLGDELPLAALDEVAVELLVGDEIAASATGGAAGGHPVFGLAWLANQLADDRRGLREGDVIITGGLTAAVPLDHHVGATFTDQNGGSSSVSIFG